MVALFFWRLCWRVAKSLCGRYYSKSYSSFLLLLLKLCTSFSKLCSCYSWKLKLENSCYAEKVGAGLHIVAAVTESCVTGHAINWFRGSNYVCGWSEVSNKEDRVLSQLCSILQFGENREEVIMGRRSRKRKLRPTGGRAISTSPCLGRWLRGSGMALKVTASFASASVGASFEYLFQVNHFYM